MRGEREAYGRLLQHKSETNKEECRKSKLALNRGIRRTKDERRRSVEEDY